VRSSTSAGFPSSFASRAAFGVDFYWIVDPSLQSLEIFELTGGRYARAARGTEGTMNRIPGCEGFSVNLEELWKEISELEPEGVAVESRNVRLRPDPFT
jgi:hypothetical protein